ncbi:membrane protein insertase YidC [uncultured Eubacterium sp.]|uniref:membrane protein insertase YidC n=1 Tax=uncultured Eubacterium sp. TaxID=165185 RepID=UPI0025DE1DF8|nr:membrane protein insertase YidC [uncultured Eubacterium sp.]
MEYISKPFGIIMNFCYNLVSNYGIAIIFFTLITKIIMFPISLWTHKNSLNLIKIQPQLNGIKAKYYGEKDKISDEQLKLYKEQHYHPLAGLIPMIVQLFLLMCVIQIIYNPLTNILSIGKAEVFQIISAVCDKTGFDISSNTVQLFAVREIQNGFSISQICSKDTENAIKSLNMNFVGFDLSATPFSAGGKMYIVPVLAGLSALALCLFQNIKNPLQAEQSKVEQIGTNAVSIGISLILGGFVPAGIGFYWICSNLFTMLQQIILNTVMNPKKHIDYDALEKSKAELEKISSIGSTSSPKRGTELYKREKTAYKRFFSVENKHLVIYAENGGFYKYFDKIITYLLNNSNIIVHYITSDPNDNIFNLEKELKNLKAYFIGEKKMVTVFMKMDADIVLMTTPDLETYYYKRSYVKKDIEYIYTVHGPMSTHMVMNKGCLDHFDTIFCVGEFQIPEIRKQEEIYKLPQKELVVCGYGFLETLQEKYDNMPKQQNSIPKILIAPSWQEGNILDSCIENLLYELLQKGYNVVVRPHPEYKKRYPNKLDTLVEKYKDYNGNDLTFELDFSCSDSIYNSDIVITDWSSTCFEFSYVTLKPCIFVDTPPKIYNKDYEEIGIEPLELTLRNIIGKRFEPNNFEGMSDTINDMLKNKDEYTDKIKTIRNKYVANYGKSGEVAGKYIINRLIQKQKEQKKNESN